MNSITEESYILFFEVELNRQSFYLKLCGGGEEIEPFGEEFLF